MVAIEIDAALASRQFVVSYLRHDCAISKEGKRVGEFMKCMIWWTPAKENNTDRDGREIISSRAGGPYFISESAEAVLENYGGHDPIRVRLTDWLVEQRRLGVRWPEISTKTIDDAKQWKNLSVSDRSDNLLRCLLEKTKEIGSQVYFRTFDKVSELDFPDDLPVPFEQKDLQVNSYNDFLQLLAYSGSINEDELQFLLAYLEKSGLIEHNKGNYYNPEETCKLTVDGYVRLEELQNPDTASSEAFVAMWFGESMNDAWINGFEPAIRDAGYVPVRIDKHEHANKIDDEIIAGIRRARFLVADFTYGEDGERGGVYYEAGFAHGLDIPVFFTCQKGFLDKIHFDTRQYNHIEWTKPEDLRKALKNRITAVIGDGPNKPPG